MHGGGSPFVKQKALERLAALVDPALVALSDIVRNKRHSSRMAAAKDILDRSGLKPVERVEVIGVADRLREAEERAALDTTPLQIEASKVQ